MNANISKIECEQKIRIVGSWHGFWCDQTSASKFEMQRKKESERNTRAYQQESQGVDLIFGFFLFSLFSLSQEGDGYRVQKRKMRHDSEKKNIEWICVLIYFVCALTFSEWYAGTFSSPILQCQQQKIIIYFASHILFPMVPVRRRGCRCAVIRPEISVRCTPMRYTWNNNKLSQELCAVSWVELCVCLLSCWVCRLTLPPKIDARAYIINLNFVICFDDGR